VAEIELSINEEKHQFILSGDLSLLTKNYRAKSYFFDVLQASFKEPKEIIIEYGEEDKESTLKRIQDVLTKYGIGVDDSPEVKKALQVFFREKENFNNFSKIAKAIWQNIVDENDFKKFVSSTESSLVSRKLYDKQLLASFHLAFSQNACNFSVPGSGKTTIVYAAYSYLKNLPVQNPKHINKLLVIGPLSSFGPWEDEYQLCFGKKPSSVRLSGGTPKEERDRYLKSIIPIEETPEIILMSYQSVPFNLPNLEYYLQRHGNNVMVVLDEAHRIKNVDGGVWAQAILSLSKYCVSRVILTGTPLPNGYEDMYNLFEFIWPGKNVVDYSVNQLKDMTNTPYDPRIPQLIENVSPYFIRIRKSHLRLPPAIETEPVYVNMGPIQREIYNFIESKYLSYFQGNDTVLSLKSELTKARFIRLMQAATNPRLLQQPLETFYQEQDIGNELFIDDSDIIRKIKHYNDLEDVPQKFIAVKDLLLSLLKRGEKVVVWGTFIQNIKELQLYLQKYDIESRLLIGEVPVERDDVSMENIITRERIIREFHQPDSPFKVILANPFAVSESISLHKACHNAIYFERTFNATHFIQSKDRIHRVGLEPKTITYYHYILSKDSIDETIHSKLYDKEKRMLQIIENEEIPLFIENMDYDIDVDNDIKAIIRDYVRRSAQL
jgi:SNF2 family DNA or RNA helicase